MTFIVTRYPVENIAPLGEILITKSVSNFDAIGITTFRVTSTFEWSISFSFQTLSKLF